MERTCVIGRRGEEEAASYLSRRGYVILEQNRRFGREEIDLIAYDSEERMIVFIEVKSRSVRHPNYPVRTAMTRRKRAALRRAIERWVQEHEYEGCARLDLLVVIKNRVVEHLKDLGSEFLI